MATTPNATAVLAPTATTPGGGTDVVCILSPCATLTDLQPRFFGSARAIADNHGYCEGVEYAAEHIAATGLPVLFVGMPIGTAGAVTRFETSNNSGTSVVSAVAGVDGVLAEHDAVVRVVAGGTIGTDQIRIEVSLDGGFSFQNIRVGTATSAVMPNVNVTLNFAAGTLVAGDTIATWHGTAPRISTSDLAAVRANLAANPRKFRSWILTQDIPDLAAAQAIATQVNAYATENLRNTVFRTSVYDRLPLASLSKSVARLTGSPSLDFVAAADTVTRDSGSWLADGFRDGDTVTFTGTSGNNISAVVTTVTATVLTFGDVITDEAGVTGAVVTGAPTLTFAAAGDTVTRNRGSWIDDGFRTGVAVTFAGTSNNNLSSTPTNVTDTVLTVGDVLTDETVADTAVTVSAGQTKAVWVAELDAAFAGIAVDEERLDLSLGRGAKFSPFSQWKRRVPAAWHASVREYQHDLHVPSWRYADGALSGVDLFDANGLLIEYDDEVDGGAASAAGFTSLKTYADNRRAAFVSQSLTRAGDGKRESLTHNMYVINEALNVVREASQRLIGRVVAVNDDGTATTDELAQIASVVNGPLQSNLLSTGPEGPRASGAVWVPDPNVLYNIPEPLLTGVLTLNLNGTIHSIATQLVLA